MYKRLLISLIFPLAAACSGGGEKPSPTVTVTPSPPAPVTLTGRVVVSSALSGTDTPLGVNAFEIRPELVGTVYEEGNFSFSLEKTAGLYAFGVYFPRLITTSPSFYVEPSTGVIVDTTLSPEPSMTMYFIHPETTTLSLNPFSYWASCYADYLIQDAITAEERITAVQQAYSAFHRVYGFRPQFALPADVTLAPEASPAIAISYLTAGLSGLSAEIAEINGQEPHTDYTYTSLNFIQLGCRDIRADGQFDGKEGEGALAIGTVWLNGTFYREKLRQHALRVAHSELNQWNVTPSDLASQLITLDETHDIFINPGSPLDMMGSAINVVEPSAVSVGVVTFPISVADVNGIGQPATSVYIDDDLIGEYTTESISQEIDTRLLTDGEHTLRIVATDPLNITSEKTVIFTTYNSASDITMTSSTLVNTKNYTLTGTYAVGDYPVDYIEVNGERATIHSELNTWSFPTVLLGSRDTFQGGVNHFTVALVDSVGVRTEETFSVSLDDRAPFIGATPTQARISNNPDDQWNLCAYLEFGFSGASGNALCLRADRLSLNGEPMELEIAGKGFLAARITYHDWPETFVVFTPGENLQVDYKYEREEGGLIRDWRPAPTYNWAGTQNSTPTEAVVALTTDFLGDDFYNTDIEEVHTVTFRVRDNAGNSREFVFNFRLNLITRFLPSS